MYRLAGKSDYGTDVLTTATSGNGADGYSLGETVFSNIEKGTYTLKEIKAPENYSLDDTEYTVQVDENGSVAIWPQFSTTNRQNNIGQDSSYTYFLEDEPLHSVVFTKKSSYDKSVLGGAVFRLYGISYRGTSAT